MDNALPPELNDLWKEARSKIENGQGEAAVEIYKYILIMYGEIPSIREKANAYLGDLYLMLKKPAIAEEYIRKAINENPDQAAHRYALGHVLSLERKWEPAIRELEIALKLEPHNGEYLRGLGWAVFSNGDTLTGLSLLHKAHEMDPQNANILTDLAVGYSNLADFRRSREYIRMALEIDPGNPLTVGAWWNIDYLQHLCHLDEDD